MWGEAFFRRLNVRREERWLVTKLFWIQFFQGAGVAFFFTSAFAPFLNHHDPSHDLPLIYICASFLLLLTGYLYGILEYRFDVTQFTRYTIWFMSASIIAIFLIAYSGIIPGFDYFLPVWYNVLYLISSLGFWGIAATVFEVRQSKRLFSIISSGDIPAKFLGYTFVWGLTNYIDASNMLIPSFIFMLLSLPFLNQIKKSGILHATQSHAAHSHHVKPDKRLKTFLKRLTSNGLIFRTAILSFIMSVCLVVANYAFYSRIKEEFHSNREFAFFISAFMAIVRILALLVKLLFTSKIMSRIGIRRALMLTPSIFIFLILIVISIELISDSKLAILYTFGVACVILDVMRTAVNTPVFLTIMQPLGIHDRLRAHNIAKGIMDPFGYLFAGIFLVLEIRYEVSVDLITLSLFLLAFAFWWIIAINHANREYYKTILTSISRKFYLQSEFVIDDNDTKQFINKQLLNGSPEEIVQILQLLQVQPGNIIEQTNVELLFKHPSDAVKEGMLKLLLLGKIDVGANPIIAIATDEKAHASLRQQAFTYLSESSAHEDILVKYLDHANYDISILCTAAILHNKSSVYYTQCNNSLIKLINSDSIPERIKAAHIIGKSKDTSKSSDLTRLMNDKESEVKAQAILSSGEMADENLIPEILKHSKTNRTEVTESIYAIGNNAVPFIVAFILGSAAGYDEKNQLIAICGRAGGDIAKGNLLDLLHHLPGHAQNILKAAHNCKGKIDHKHKALLEDFAQRKIADACEILFMQKLLSHYHKGRHDLLFNALTLELLATRESILYIFAMLYGEAEIEKVRRGLKLGNAESIANALEVIEMTVHKKFTHDFAVICETGDLDQRCALLRSRRGSDINDIKQLTGIILNNSADGFDQWTKSCSIYISQKGGEAFDHTLTKRYIFSDYPVLKETANFTFNQHMENKLLLLEKVLMLKKTAVFAETPENVLADLAPLMQEVAYEEGQTIFKEGAFGDSMFIIYQGSVRIHKDNTTLVVLSKENEVFGELSLFDAEKRSASATAQTDCVLYKIDQLPFFELIEVRPEIVMGAIKILSKRLRAQNERLVQMSNQ